MTGRIRIKLDSIKDLTFTKQSQLLTNSEKITFQNIEGKGENASNQYFLLFSQYFLPIP